jgi:serine/threonine protein kinase
MSRIIPEKVQNQEMGLDDAGNVVSKEERESQGTNEYRESQYSEFGMPITRDGSNNIGSAAGLGRPTDLTDSQNVRISAAASGGNRYSSFHPEMTSNLGTTAWCAPELLTAANTTRYSVKVDVYSFGMVMWELWEKRRPYDEFHSRFDITDAIRAGKRPIISDNCPRAWKSLLQRCWQAEPARRPTFKYIEKYLKDELARIRRQKQTAGGSSYGYHGRFSSGDRSASGLSNSLLNSNTSLSSDVEARPTIVKERRSSPVPITNPIHAPEGRSPLVAFERSFSYLAKSLETSSSLSTDSFGQSPANLPTFKNNNLTNSNGSADGTSGSKQSVNSITSSMRPNQDAPTQKGWRDRYVLKFSGWQQSNPDAGLPPAKPMASNSNGGSNHKTVAMELRTHNASSTSSSAANSNIRMDSIEEISRESGTTATTLRESVMRESTLRPSHSGMSTSALEGAFHSRPSPNAVPAAAVSNFPNAGLIAVHVNHQESGEIFAMDDDAAAAEPDAPAVNQKDDDDSGNRDDSIVRPSFGIKPTVNMS